MFNDISTLLIIEKAMRHIYALVACILWLSLYLTAIFKFWYLIETWCEGYFYINLTQARVIREEGLSTGENASTRFTSRHENLHSIFLIDDWLVSSAHWGNVIPEQVVLDDMRKLAEQATRGKPVSSSPPMASALLPTPRCLTNINYCHDIPPPPSDGEWPET